MRKAMIYVGKDKDQALDDITENSRTILADYGQSVLAEFDNENNLKTLDSKGYRIREIKDSPIVQVGEYRLDTTSPEVSSSSSEELSLKREHPDSGRSHYILRLIGPLHSEWRSKLEQIGVRFYQKLSQDNYYLIGVDNNRINELYQNEFVKTLVPYYSSLKVDPSLITEDQFGALGAAAGITPVHPFTAKPPAASPSSASDMAEDQSFDDIKKRNKKIDVNIVEEGNIEIILFDENPSDLQQVTEALNTMDEVRIIKAEENRIVAYANLNILPKIADIPPVRRVEPHSPVGPLNNIAEEIIKSVPLLNNHKLDGRGQIIAVADTGLDKGIDDSTMMADFRGRIVRIFALGRPDDASDIDGHGTHVAGSVLGDGSNSNRKICGVAPAAKLIFQSTVGPLPHLNWHIPHDLRKGLFDVARDNGAVLHSNSWGLQCLSRGNCPSSGRYSIQSEQADDFAFNNRMFLILFAAGNDGDESHEVNRRVSPPGSAKNVLTVGASENLRPLPSDVVLPNSSRPVDLSKQADGKDHIAAFSSIGPVQNDRMKPDVVAPGTWILSTRSSVSMEDWGTKKFTRDKAVGYGLPGGPAFGRGNKNLPLAPDGSGSMASDNYMYSSGTSMSTPLTTGACALLRQYFVERRGVTPSAALVKAAMINGAVDMGMGVPHKGQGWGRIDLDNTLFPPGSRQIVFDDSLDNAVATGEIRTYEFSVSSVSDPLSVTLVWRDPPGPTIQNKLHLRLIHKDSGTGYTSEDRENIHNNVQKIVIKAPKPGKYRIEVEGVDLADGIPELPPTAIRQDYAVVVSNTTALSIIT